MNWEYELAKRMKVKKEQAPFCMEGKVVSTSPLTVSVYDGEIMAPPATLSVVETAPGYTVINHILQKLPWKTGDRVACAWMGKGLVVLGRLS